MADTFPIDFRDNPAYSTAFEELKKLGQYANQIREEDARAMRVLQRMTIPDVPNIDTDALRNAIADCKTETIVPDGYFENTQAYQQKSLEILQAINENTANLYTIVELINKNNEKQDELIALMTDILSLAKAKDKAAAGSLFKRVLEKITNTFENVESIIKIVSWATTVYNMVLPLLS